MSDVGVIRVRLAADPAPPAVRVFLRSPRFDYVAAAGALLDELCWGCGCTFSSDLEAALIQMVVAVGEDLEAAIARMGPMMSLVAGAAQESQHMLFQMKKDVAAALQNDHRSLALGRLHQFMEQLTGSGSEMGLLMPLPQSFKDAAASFMAAKTACLEPVAFRRKLRQALDAAVQLHSHISSSSSPPTSNTAALTKFISEAASVAAHFTAATAVTAAEVSAAALLRPSFLGPRLPSLLFMPVLSMEDLQVTHRPWHHVQH